MKPRPLLNIDLKPQSLFSALWWLSLLYRRPDAFRDNLESKLGRDLCLVLKLLLHLTLVAISVMFLGRLLLDYFYARPGIVLSSLVASSLTGLGLGLAAGMVVALMNIVFLQITSLLTLGVPLFSEWIAFWLTRGGAVGICSGTVLGISWGHPSANVEAVGLGLAFGMLSANVMVFSKHKDRWTRGVQGLALLTAFAVGLMVLSLASRWLGHSLRPSIVAALVGAASHLFFYDRLHYLIIHLALLMFKNSPQVYRLHPAAWDDLSGTRFPGLSRLLVEYALYDPQAGVEEIDRIIDCNATQRVEALRAKIILIAREAKRVPSLSRLPEVCAKLPEGEKDFLKETHRIREKVLEISNLQLRLDGIDRPFLREPTALSLLKTIEAFREQVAGFHEPTGSEFRAAASEWLRLSERQLEQAIAVLDRPGTPQVFRAGDPVDRDREAFVPRFTIFGSLERQVTLATGCPGLLLYGRRRMGKSTLIKNLAGFLPPTVYVVSISLQSPEAFTSVAHFVGLVHLSICQVRGLEDDPPDDLPSLHQFLSRVDVTLVDDEQRLLIALDEFEMIDQKVREGVFPKDVLAFLRESMQSHRNIVWVFSGSHSLEELSGADWSSYLVSVRMVEVYPFSNEETRLLLTNPMQYSRLFSENSADRPRIRPEFWGDGGIVRIQEQTGGWPHLVQLVAETLVDLSNDQGSDQVGQVLFETALDRSVVAGDAVFSQLLRLESRIPGEWSYLLKFGDREYQPAPKEAEIRRSLRRRMVILEKEEGWILRAPLFRRWLQRWW